MQSFKLSEHHHALNKLCCPTCSLHVHTQAKRVSVTFSTEFEVLYLSPMQNWATYWKEFKWAFPLQICVLNSVNIDTLAALLPRAALRPSSRASIAHFMWIKSAKKIPRGKSYFAFSYLTSFSGKHILVRWNLSRLTSFLKWSEENRLWRLVGLQYWMWISVWHTKFSEVRAF